MIPVLAAMMRQVRPSYLIINRDKVSTKFVIQILFLKTFIDRHGKKKWYKKVACVDRKIMFLRYTDDNDYCLDKKISYDY